MRALAQPAAVTPQNWLFLGSFRAMRGQLLCEARLSLIAGLGARAFETISGEVVNVALVVLTEERSNQATRFAALDANKATDPPKKMEEICTGALQMLKQEDQLGNPDFMIVTTQLSTIDFLTRYAATKAFPLAMLSAAFEDSGRLVPSNNPIGNTCTAHRKQLACSGAWVASSIGLP